MTNPNHVRATTKDKDNERNAAAAAAAAAQKEQDIKLLKSHSNMDVNSLTSPALRTAAKNLGEQEAEITKGRQTLNTLHAIQVALALCMLGGAARLVLTSFNGFAPGFLDDAFDDFDDTFSDQGGAAAMRGIVAASLFCVALDVVYFVALRTRDLCDFNIKTKEYEEAVKFQNNELYINPANRKAGAASPATPSATLTSQQTQAILDEAEKNAREELDTNAQARTKYLELIKEDIFIRELMIQCDIHAGDLLKRIEQEGKNANILGLIKEYSTNISLKDYKNEHKTHQEVMRYIEYAQGIKVPLRFISMILLLDDRAFELPHLFKKFRMDFLSMEEPAYEWIIMGGIFLFGLMLYAYFLEFKKNDALIELDKKSRALTNGKHNAILATLFLALERKTRENSIVKAPEEIKEKPAMFSTWLDITLYESFRLKPIISLLCLGSLGRRPLTISGLAGEDNPEGAILALIIIGVIIAISLDVKQISLSAKEERWSVKNKENKDYVLSACRKVEEQNIDTNTDQLKENEAKLYWYLSQESSPASSPESNSKNDKKIKGNPDSFKNLHPFLHGFKNFFDKTLCVKFALRAMGVVWGVIQIAASEEFKQASVGELSSSNFVMILAGGVGFLLGMVAQRMNTMRDKVINEEDEYAKVDYTQNKLLFFKDPVVAGARPTPTPPSPKS